MVFLVPVLVVLLVGWAVVWLVRRVERRAPVHDAEHEARALRRTAFAGMAVFSLFVGAFVVGETFADPGGWAAVGLVSAWAVPLVVVAVLVRWQPDLALRVLGGLVALMVALSAWFALDPQAWRDFEDAHGPVRTVATFAIAVALALLGLRRPGAAGLELVLLTVVPPLVAVLGSRAGSSSLLAVATVPFLAGVLFLAAAWVGRGGPPGRHRTVH